MCLAIPGKIESICGEGLLDRFGKVNFGGIVKDVNLGYVPEAQVGDYVVVHVGFALSRVDEEEAMKVFDYLKQMEDMAELAESTALEPPLEAGGVHSGSGASPAPNPRSAPSA